MGQAASPDPYGVVNLLGELTWGSPSTAHPRLLPFDASGVKTKGQSSVRQHDVVPRDNIVASDRGTRPHRLDANALIVNCPRPGLHAGGVEGQ